MAKTKEPGVIHQLKITLRDIKPPVTGGPKRGAFLEVPRKQ